MDGRCRVGLTGPVGAGKSAVLALLGERGADVLDADRLVHRLLAEDDVVRSAVVARFAGAIGEGAAVDRAALAALVFDDPAALADLEAIVHPAVARRVDAWFEERGGVCVVEAVKLVESGMHEGLESVWLVTCEWSERLRRLEERGWSAEEANRRAAAGGDLAAQLAAADVVIDNTGTREATRRQVGAAWSDLAQCVGEE